MTADPRVEAVRDELIASGAGPGSSLHGWRCEYPDRYGPCDCVTETARDIVAALDEGLRRDYLAMRAERDDARRHAAELDARLTRMTHDSAARDRVAPMKEWEDR